MEDQTNLEGKIESNENPDADENENEVDVKYVNFRVITPTGTKLDIQPVSFLETPNFIKQILAEISDSCAYTNYHLEYAVDNSQTILMNEYVELLNFFTDPNEDRVEIFMVLEDYDIRTARIHVKRVREILSLPRSAFGNSDDNQADGNDATSDNANEASKKGTASQLKMGDKPVENSIPESTSSNEEEEEVSLVLPDEKEVFDKLSLNSFYYNTLFRVGQSGAINTLDSFSSTSFRCQMTISFSGWNPPPPTRRSQGDYFYLEVSIKGESKCIFITSCNVGFFVNKSTLDHFDPTPAANAHFSHELLHTLISCSPSLHASWEASSSAANISKPKNPSSTSSTTKLLGALDSIASVYMQGRGDQVTSSPHWILPPNSLTNSISYPAQIHGSKSSVNEAAATALENSLLQHSYDQSRAVDDLTETFGVDDRSAPREWNEEIQAVRHINPKDLAQKIMQAKYVHKVVTDFTDACRLAAMAILDGHVSPLNLLDNESSYVYLYNNIFLSRAVDSKDTFKLVEGDEASRKIAGHELKSQKVIQTFRIEGLSTTLTTLIDIKGERIVGQAIIPGILSVSGDKSARLLYGTLEGGKRLRSKKEIQPLLTTLSSALGLTLRNIPAIPIPGALLAPPAPQVTAGLFKDAEAGQQDQSILVDDDDEDLPIDSPSVVHTGPVEAKLLKGADGRIYALEFMRLTPKDANYVEAPRGTGLMSKDILNEVDENIANTYLLRRELIQHYLQHRVKELRHKAMQDVVQAQRDAHANASAATATNNTVTLPIRNDSTTTTTTTITSGDEQETTVVTANTTASSAASAADINANALDLETNDSSKQSNLVVTDELLRTLSAIQVETIGLRVNSNCFFSFDCDVDQGVRDSDEDTAKSLATFLWDAMLPSLTEKVRTGELIVYDGAHLRDTLHSFGVNMRYLGQLMKLALAEEAEDDKLLAAGQRRRHPMPLCWVDLLQTEMIARVVKHIVTLTLRKKKAIQMAPAFTLSAILSYCLGSEDMLCGICEPDESPLSPKENGHHVPAGKSSKKKKATAAVVLAKNGKKEQSLIGNADSSATTVTSTHIPVDITNYESSKEEFWKSVRKLLSERFCCDLECMLLPKSKGLGFGLNDRIPRLSLLRRICQLTGIRVALKHYDFSLPIPITVEDIVSLSPVVKSSILKNPIKEIKELMEEARSQLNEQRLGEAYAYAQECYNMLQQISGPVSKSSNVALDCMTTILEQAGDFRAAFSMASKGLAVAVQLDGLDSYESLKFHLRLAVLANQLEDYYTAIQHLLTVKYLLNLLAGPRHTEFLNIYNQLAVQFTELKAYPLAYQCLVVAKELGAGGDQLRLGLICQHHSDICLKLDKFEEAQVSQSVSYTICKQLLGDDDNFTVVARNRFEKIRRLVTEKAVAEARKKQADLAAEQERQLTADWLDDDAAAAGSGNGNQLKKKKGKKSSKKK